MVNLFLLNSINFCFIYFEARLLGIHTFMFYLPDVLTHHFIIIIKYLHMTLAYAEKEDGKEVNVWVIFQITVNRVFKVNRHFSQGYTI